MTEEDGRLSTGIVGLDRMLTGGFQRGDANLVAGSPGTGKTTIGLHYIVAGIKAGEPGVVVTFEYLPQQIYRDAAKRGWDLRKWEKEGMLRLLCTTPDVMMAEAEPGKSLLDEAINEIRAKRLVIDSMTHFEFSGKPDHELREDLAGLMTHLRLLKVTPLVTHEIPEIIGPAVRISNYGLEFLVDSVILLRYVELEGEMQKAVNVLKFRGGDHDRYYRKLVLSDKGATVAGDFSGVENISGGSARRSVADRARELV